LKTAAVGVVIWNGPVSAVFNLADASMAVIATINLVAIPDLVEARLNV
jgi:AGCS family alanine or glycine:cation symporter